MSYAIHCDEHLSSDSQWTYQGGDAGLWDDRMDAELAALQQTEQHKAGGMDCNFIVRDADEPAKFGAEEAMVLLMHGVNVFSDTAPLWEPLHPIPNGSRDALNRILGKRPKDLGAKDQAELMALVPTLQGALVPWAETRRLT